MKKRTYEIGTWFAVPLGNGRFGHLQLVGRAMMENASCDLVLAVRPRTTQPATIEELAESPIWFGPVLTVVNIGVKQGWRILGHSASRQLGRPVFKDTGLAAIMADPAFAKIWSPDRGLEPIGDLAPEEFYSLEEYAVLSPAWVRDRLATVSGYLPTERPSTTEKA